MDCRGFVPEAYLPEGNWQCKSAKSERRFTSIALGEDWAEYDEDADASLLISNFEAKFERL